MWHEKRTCKSPVNGNPKSQMGEERLEIGGEEADRDGEEDDAEEFVDSLPDELTSFS